ncbi:hypothetical protein HpMS53_02710 [Helicobacter pylori]|nr:hypothetical protein [Helicobacter pylori]GHR62075.1 hypothetical protein VN1266_13110 [Helicobacter pylori]
MKTWNEMDIKEQKELFVKFLASEIAQSLDAGLEFIMAMWVMPIMA